jgi:hypothetical protein
MARVSIRQSQVVSTFGPGALVDLPDHAVLVAGLEHWLGDAPIVHEDRLLTNLRRRLALPALELRAPPVPERDDQVNVGLAAWQFPEWFIVQYERVSKEHGRSRPLVHRKSLRRGKYDLEDSKGKLHGWPVVPVRFVQGCPNGHISDIDWHRIVHGNAVTCAGSLWLDERGTTGDLAELWVRCDLCGKALSLVRLQSTAGDKSVLGDCKGDRLWLGPAAREACSSDTGAPQKNRLLIRHASNAYFPLIERAISIPDADDKLRKAVDAVWEDFLQYAEGAQDVKKERKKERVNKALASFSDDKIWAECQRRAGGPQGPQKTLKDVELDTFLSVPDELGEDVAEGDFYARRLPQAEGRGGAAAAISRVVLVHRLREVVAQVGFTRFEAPTQPVDAEVALGVRVASLALDVRWLPAIENRGEGVFLALDAHRVREWLERKAVKVRADQFRRGLQGAEKRDIPEDVVREVYMPYILLHSLSHLLLTAVSLECGYAAASIRERIYVRSGSYGLLLYTGTPDAEGTLGGLVEIGRRMDRHIAAAIELGALCSNDPVCAQHPPDHYHEGRALHGAACHGCLLIAEPSCERRNELLDRALVVPSVETADLAFFPEA